MFWYGSHWGWWEVALSWVGMVAFWVLIVGGIYLLVTGARGTPAPRGGDARTILDERLARGEIDADEYRRLRGLIESPPTQRV